MSTFLNSNCSAKYLVFQWDSPGGKEARCLSFTELTYEIFINIVLDSFCGFYLFFFCLSLSRFHYCSLGCPELLCVHQASLELRSSCLCLPGAGLKG